MTPRQRPKAATLAACLIAFLVGTGNLAAQTGTGSLTIVASGGDSGTYTVSGGVLATTAAVATVDASVIVGLLSGDLTVDAEAITVGAAVTATGSGSLTLDAGSGAVVVNAGISVAAGLSMEGGSVTINGNLSTSSLTDGILLKAAGSVIIDEGHAVLTNGGDVTLWADSDADRVGGIRVGDDFAGVFTTSILTSGGDIVLSGGSDLATGFASYDSTLGAAYSAYRYGVGIFGAQLDASGPEDAGGNITIRGNGGNTFDGLLWTVNIGGQYGANTTVKTNGTGTITVEGDMADAPANATANSSRNAWAMSISGLIESDAGAITLIGTSTVARTNARGFALTGSAIQSTSGRIRLEDRTANTANGNYTGPFVYGVAFGQGSLASASGDIEFIFDKGAFENAPSLATSGTITVRPYNDDFLTTNPLAGLSIASAGGLAIGDSTSTQTVVISTDLEVDGSVSIYGGSIDVQADITATGGDILLDADVGSTLNQNTHGINLDASGTIQTLESGNITLIGRSGSGVCTGVCKGIKASGAQSTHLRAAGDLSLTGYSFGGTPSGGRGVDLVNDTLVAGGSITIVGSHAVGSSYAVAIASGSALQAGSGVTLESLTDGTGTVVIQNSGGIDAGSGDVVIRTAVLGLWVDNSQSIQTSGSVTILPDSDMTSFSQPINTTNLPITGASGLTIGQSGNTADIVVGSDLSVAGPIQLFAGDVTIDAALSAATDDVLFIEASGTISDGELGSVSGNTLILVGTGTATLDSESNDVDTIIVGTVLTGFGSVTYIDSAGLEVGSWTGDLALAGVASGGRMSSMLVPSGIVSIGEVSLATLEGDLTISEIIATTSDSHDAIRLFAGLYQPAGTASGGDIVVSGTPTLTMGSEGIAKLYSGSEDGSPGLTDLVGGTANTRLLVDATTTTFSPPLSAGNAYALYRAGVVISPSASTTGGSSTALADGEDEGSITVILRDDSGNPVAGAVVELTQNPAGASTIQPAFGVTDENGQVVFTVTSETIGEVEYTATAQGSSGPVELTQKASMQFVAGPVSLTGSRLRTNDEPVDADGEDSAVIEVRLLDDFGHPLSDLRVRLEQNEGASSVIEPAFITTDGNGFARFTVSDFVAETVTYTVWVTLPDGTEQRLEATAVVVFAGVIDLSFAQHVSDTVPALGDTITVRYEVTNHGSGGSDEVVLQGGILSPRLQIVGQPSVPAGTVLDLSAGTWRIPSVRGGATLILEFRAIVTPGEPAGSQTSIRGGGR